MTQHARAWIIHQWRNNDKFVWDNSQLEKDHEGQAYVGKLRFTMVDCTRRRLADAFSKLKIYKYCRGPYNYLLNTHICNIK